MSEAIDHLKVRAGATSVVLVGYSGGGAMAALIAARRTDVVAMVTVAGNLDVAGWTAWHRISPLKTSLDPSDFIRELSPIPQWHFTGADDAVVPSSLVRSFVDRFPDRSNAQIVEVRGFDHRCCWADAWPRLIVETGL